MIARTIRHSSTYFPGPLCSERKCQCGNFFDKHSSYMQLWCFPLSFNSKKKHPSFHQYTTYRTYL